MSNGGPGINVTGPLLSPPQVGLFSAADALGTSVETDNTVLGIDQTLGAVERWGGGIHWQGDGALAGVDQIVCSSGLAFALPVPPSQVNAFPYTTYGAWSCSTYQTGLLPEYIDHARRRHLAFEQFAVERELFSDTLAIGNAKLSGAGSNAVEVSPIALTPYKAFARLEAAFAAAYPAPFMLHITPLVFSLLQGVSSSQFTQRGNVWVTGLGNIVVVGRGYSGNGPTGTAASAIKQWIYASTPVQVARGQIMTLADPVQTVNRLTNDKAVYSFRLDLATFNNVDVPPMAYPVDIS